MTGPVPSQSQKLGTPSPHTFTLLYPLYTDATDVKHTYHITDMSLHDVPMMSYITNPHHHVML